MILVPLAAVIVMLYVPGVVFLRVVTVSIEVPVPSEPRETFTGLKDKPRAPFPVRVTVPSNPLRLATVIVQVAVPPA